MRIHCLENVDKALQFLKEQKVHLENMGSHDIVDGNHRLTLGLIWTIILRFQVILLRCLSFFNCPVLFFPWGKTLTHYCSLPFWMITSIFLFNTHIAIKICTFCGCIWDILSLRWPVWLRILSLSLIVRYIYPYHWLHMVYGWFMFWKEQLIKTEHILVKAY